MTSLNRSSSRSSSSHSHLSTSFPYNRDYHNRLPFSSTTSTPKMTSSVVDYEDLVSTSFSDTNRAVRSNVRPRWERKAAQGTGGDRFIPNRSTMDMDLSSHMLRNDENNRNSSNNLSSSSMSTVSDTTKEEYKSALSATILGVDRDKSSRILSFKDKAPAPRGDTVNNLNILYSTSAGASARSKSSNTQLVTRTIPSCPTRILDAPELLDDYYLNLLSWSDTNILAVALTRKVYLWNAANGEIQELCSMEGGPADAHISSVSWVQEGGTHLAVGDSNGSTQLWDVYAEKQVRKMDGHSDRVSALAWNRHVVSSGSRDTSIVNHDVRLPRHNVSTMYSHTQEICGLQWSKDGQVLASGGNDNKLCLWDASASSRTPNPRCELTDHQAAVKALAWSPHDRHVLASGGGTADRTIKFWNGRSGALLNSIDTESQVCALQWNPHEKEILSGHGFVRNQLCLWKYPSMVKIKELEGHTARVLHMACSPNGGTVVSAAADETLRFWDVFAPPAEKSKRKRHAGAGDLTSMKFSRTMQLR